ncbi:MAG TPA: hypothetical protein VHZ56_02150 [Devosia sp.]|nr:hypothetical protein [Devosia sp.]
MSTTIRLHQPLAVLLALGAIAVTSSAALAESRDFGPHTRAQIDTICDTAHGQRTLGPAVATWGCNGTHFAIACKLSGKTCIIDLFGIVTDGTIASASPPSAGSGDTLNPGTGNPPPGTGGGGVYAGPARVDTSGLGLSQSGGSGGDTLTGVNGGGGDHGAGLQPLPGH